MKSISVAITLVVILLLAVALPGCSAIEQFFATQTPTPTDTPTATSTFTPTFTSTFTVTSSNTPTLTATPKPPVSILGCVGTDNCPESQTIKSFFPPDMTIDYNVEYPVSIPYNTNLRFYEGWCAIDQYTLDQNLEHVKFVFTIDGQSYADSFKTDYSTQQDSQDPNKTYPCFAIGGVLSGWKIGESHQIIVGLIVKEKIFDGWDNYNANTISLHKYDINPAEIPTPLPTKTLRPLPTWTPRPKNSPTPACGEMGRIEITNDTGGYVTLNLSGPATYSFDLPTGGTTLTVCAGSYDYKAWGCGGASDSGSMGTGSSHRFYCQ